ncbi:unnamed protein product [Pocillopora meandrina]|uniref:G-protein coupled receptors family 1 profile domain-containing protein n=1 Tax=Pocillopora meandrina TaxID=46732 RepID=A0AAU9WK09_9CNID|nr:unnamed protein product [Pocillopora meandrina]
METNVCFINEDNLHLIFGIVYFLASLTASIGNGFMLYIARRDPLKLFNKPTNVLNVSIGLNHLIASLFVLPILGTNSVLQSQEIVNGVAELFQDVMVHFVVTNASVLLLVLFLERYTAFVYPFLNLKNATIERAKQICSSVTATCFFFSCILFTGVSEDIFYDITLPVFILLPCTVMTVMLAISFCLLRRRTRVAQDITHDSQIRVMNPNSSSNESCNCFSENSRVQTINEASLGPKKRPSLRSHDKDNLECHITRNIANSLMFYWRRRELVQERTMEFRDENNKE